MIGTFEADNIKRFMDDFLYGKTPQYSVTLSDADFRRVVCEQEQEVREPTEEDPIVKEIVEEEKRKREQFEKEREEAMKKKKRTRKKIKRE